MTVVAIVHPTDLIGKELRESLERRRELWSEILLLTPAAEEFGTLTELAGAPAVVGRADADGLSTADVAFFCGSEPPEALSAALPAAATAVWMHPQAVPADAVPVVAGVNLDRVRKGEILASPHPGAVLLSHLLAPLVRFGLRAATAFVVQPASLSEERGLDELLDQTRRLLAMTGREAPEVFGTQLAFNLLPSPVSGPVIARQAASVLATAADAEDLGDGDGGSAAPELAVQVVQGAVFHGVSAAIRCELADGAAAPPSPEELRQALAEHPVNRLAEEPELLGPIDAAASEEVLVGEVQAASAAAGGGYWIWGVMDNLTRGSALNAVAILERLAGRG